MWSDSHHRHLTCLPPTVLILPSCIRSIIWTMPSHRTPCTAAPPDRLVCFHFLSSRWCSYLVYFLNHVFCSKLDAFSLQNLHFELLIINLTKCCSIVNVYCQSAKLTATAFGAFDFKFWTEQWHGKGVESALLLQPNFGLVSSPKHLTNLLLNSSLIIFHKTNDTDYNYCYYYYFVFCIKWENGETSIFQAATWQGHGKKEKSYVGHINGMGYTLHYPCGPKDDGFFLQRQLGVHWWGLLLRGPLQTIIRL